MLTLDHTTLFYFSLRDLDADRHAQLVNDWVKEVPSNANPRSTRRKSTPALTHGSTRSAHRPRLAPSALPAADISPHDNGVETIECDLSDLDGTEGDEQEVAIESPRTGRQRMLSLVSLQFVTIFSLTFWTV